MRFKKILMIGVMATALVRPFPAHSFSNCGTIIVVPICGFQDVVGAALAAVVHLAMQHTADVHYDVKQGLEQIKENIGMYQNEGKCGVSATGNTGCNLLTEEEGAAMQEEEAKKAAEAAAVIPDSTISIIEKAESKGEITSQGSTFDQVRSNVEEYMFASEKASDPVNSDCQCDAGVGEACDPTECAQTRQNNALATSVSGASGAADTYLRDIEENYNRLDDLVADANTAKTIADFVGKLSLISIYASSAVVDQMVLQAHDLRAQSYRSLIAAGVTKVDMSTLKKGENK